MHLARPRRFVVAALAALAVSLGALAGCTMVGDSLTGVQLEKNGPTTCIKQCNDDYKLLFEEERKRHLAALEQCQALSGDDKTVCLQTESATHAANKDAFAQGKIDCQNNCHRQGSGSGG